MAQEYLPTEFDWRIGVLDNKPLFACQYHMVKGHWQIIQHDLNGSFVEGDHKTIPLNETPPEVLDVALLAARGVGVGLYGVDIKASSKGVVAIEVNDNPNLEHGIEDEKDEVFLKILDWFAKRVN